MDALRGLKEQGIPFSYTIISAEGNEELTFLRQQMNLTEEVELLGKVPFEQVKERIRQADVLLLPSVEEGIANVVLESMFLGTLVVTTDCGGMVESVEHGHSGLVVPVRNTNAMTSALVQVAAMAQDDRQIMIEHAFEKVSAQHNEEKMVNDMVSLYDMVMQNQPSAS